MTRPKHYRGPRGPYHYGPRKIRELSIPEVRRYYKLKRAGIASADARRVIEQEARKAWPALGLGRAYGFEIEVVE